MCKTPLPPAATGRLRCRFNVVLWGGWRAGTWCEMWTWARLVIVAIGSYRRGVDTPGRHRTSDPDHGRQLREQGLRYFRRVATDCALRQIRAARLARVRHYRSNH